MSNRIIFFLTWSVTRDEDNGKAAYYHIYWSTQSLEGIDFTHLPALLDNRSCGGAQLKRTFYARGQTGQQLLLGAYQALEKEVAKGHIEMFSYADIMTMSSKKDA